jgi:hypothetical protein
MTPRFPAAPTSSVRPTTTSTSGSTPRATGGADGGLKARQWPNLIDQLKQIDNPTVLTRPSHAGD